MILWGNTIINGQKKINEDFLKNIKSANKTAKKDIDKRTHILTKANDTKQPVRDVVRQKYDTPDRQLTDDMYVNAPIDGYDRASVNEIMSKVFSAKTGDELIKIDVATRSNVFSDDLMKIIKSVGIKNEPEDHKWAHPFSGNDLYHTFEYYVGTRDQWESVLKKYNEQYGVQYNSLTDKDGSVESIEKNIEGQDKRESDSVPLTDDEFEEILKNYKDGDESSSSHTDSEKMSDRVRDIIFKSGKKDQDDSYKYINYPDKKIQKFRNFRPAPKKPELSDEEIKTRSAVKTIDVLSSYYDVLKVLMLYHEAKDGESAELFKNKDSNKYKMLAKSYLSILLEDDKDSTIKKIIMDDTFFDPNLHLTQGVSNLFLDKNNKDLNDLFKKYKNKKSPYYPSYIENEDGKFVLNGFLMNVVKFEDSNPFEKIKNEYTASRIENDNKTIASKSSDDVESAEMINDNVLLRSGEDTFGFVNRNGIKLYGKSFEYSDKSSRDVPDYMFVGTILAIKDRVDGYTVYKPNGEVIGEYDFVRKNPTFNNLTVNIDDYWDIIDTNGDSVVGFVEDIESIEKETPITVNSTTRAGKENYDYVIPIIYNDGEQGYFKFNGSSTTGNLIFVEGDFEADVTVTGVDGNKLSRIKKDGLFGYGFGGDKNKPQIPCIYKYASENFTDGIAVVCDAEDVFEYINGDGSEVYVPGEEDRFYSYITDFDKDGISLSFSEEDNYFQAVKISYGSLNKIDSGECDEILADKDYVHLCNGNYRFIVKDDKNKFAVFSFDGSKFAPVTEFIYHAVMNKKTGYALFGKSDDNKVVKYFLSDDSLTVEELNPKKKSGQPKSS